MSVRLQLLRRRWISGFESTPVDIRSTDTTIPGCCRFADPLERPIDATGDPLDEGVRAKRQFSITVRLGGELPLQITR